MNHQFYGETDFIETRENLIDNPSFEESSSGWVMNNAYRVSINETGIMENILGNYAVKINGDAKTKKYFSQSILNDINQNKTYIIGCWAKASAVPKKATIKNGTVKADGRFFGIELMFDYYNEETDVYSSLSYYFPFNSNIDDWQFQLFSFKAPDLEDVFRISINLVYQGTGEAFFDNIQIYQDKFGTEYKYDIDNGNLIETISSSGTITDYEYNGNDIIKVKSNDIITDIVRRPNGQIESIIRNNVKVSYHYNSLNQVDIITYGSISDKWFSSKTDYASTFQYVSSVTNEFGGTTTYNTDSSISLITSIYDSIGNNQSFNYNSFGDIEGVQFFDQIYQKTKSYVYHYDEVGRLSKLYKEGFYYEFIYDALDRIQSVKVAGVTIGTNNYLSETYGGNSYETNKLASLVYGDGDIMEFAYDNEDRISQVKFNGTLRFEYKYDASGRIAKYIDYYNNKEFDYEYDLSGRVVKASSDNYLVTYDYNNNGNLSNYYYNINGTSRNIFYNYDLSTGEYRNTNYVVGSNFITKNYNYSNDSLRRLSTIELFFGSSKYTRTFIYDDDKVDSSMGNATNRIKSVKYEIGLYEFDHRYQYDSNNNIIYKDTYNGSQYLPEKYEYKYDGFGQLKEETVYLYYIADYKNKYDYDNNGNITSIKKYSNSGILLSEKSFQDDYPWKDQVSKINYYENGILKNYETITYDNSGNIIKRTDSKGKEYYLVWDGRNLVSYSWYPNGITFKYNDQGIRTQKIYGGFGRVTETTKYYLDGNKILLEDRGTRGKIYYTYDVDGSLISMNYNGNEYFYITNLQGDVIQLVDINGNIVAGYRYDAWGNIIDQYGSDIANINPFRYRSYYFDYETSLYYCNSRYYNPEWGRWLNADDVSYLDPSSVNGLNLYAYCLNNPVMYSDPSGHFVITISMLITAAIIGAVSGGVIGAAYGGLTAVANGQDFWTGALVGGLSGAFMGAGAGIGAVFIAPVLAGASITFATASGAGFVMGTALSSGTALAIGAGVAFGTGSVGGALADISSQLLYDGKVSNWGSVGWSALQWGTINTLNAFACAGFEAFQIAGTALGYGIAEAITVTSLMNIGFGSGGFLIDVLRANASKRRQSQLSLPSFNFAYGF